MSNFENKNILFFQDSILPAAGGVCRVSDIVSKELAGRGYLSHFVYYEVDNEDYSDQIKLRVDLKQSYKQFEDSILNFIKINKINIFIIQYAKSKYFIKIYNRIRVLYPDFPIICFLHASPDYWQGYRLKGDSLEDKLMKNILKKFIKKIIYPFHNYHVSSILSLYEVCNKFVLLSESFKETFIRLYNINPIDNKLVILPNPLTFKNAITPKGLIEKEKIILIVSRFDEQQKRISIALKIWQIISQNNPDEWKLIIVGDGPYGSYYKNYVNNNKIKNVIFTGQKKNVIEYYLKASIFIMTSAWEGLPMSLLEAKQNGVVPIAFDNFSSIYEIISNNETGYIIENNDINLFAEKVAYLMMNDEARQHMALKSIETTERFQLVNIVDEWEELIKESKDFATYS
jgi:glycosyltransferase involved in cell wall biosynthesis